MDRSIGNRSTTDISNTLDGVPIQAGTQFNQMVTNTIAFNEANGVYITGNGTDSNQRRVNTIRANQRAEVDIDGGAAAKGIGWPGNRLFGNAIQAELKLAVPNSCLPSDCSLRTLYLKTSEV